MDSGSPALPSRMCILISIIAASLYTFLCITHSLKSVFWKQVDIHLTKKTRRKKISLSLDLPFRNRYKRAGLDFIFRKQSKKISAHCWCTQPSPGAWVSSCPHTQSGIYWMPSTWADRDEAEQSWSSGLGPRGQRVRAPYTDRGGLVSSTGGRCDPTT